MLGQSQPGTAAGQRACARAQALCHGPLFAQRQVQVFQTWSFPSNPDNFAFHASSSLAIFYLMGSLRMVFLLKTPTEEEFKLGF